MADATARAAPTALDSPFVTPPARDGAAPRAAAALPAAGAGEATRSTRDRELAAQIALLDLAPIQRAYLTERWLSELAYLSASARRHQRYHYILQMILIVGGVTVPALVGLHVGLNDDKANVIQAFTFVLGLVVAVAAALEGFFRWGERWRHFRLRREQLVAEGWAFLELAGAYRRFDTHQEAFRSFVTRAEDKISQEVQVYITEVVRTEEPAGSTGRRDPVTGSRPAVPGGSTAADASGDARGSGVGSPGQ